jgi:hypothetical protein
MKNRVLKELIKKFKDAEKRIKQRLDNEERRLGNLEK